MISADNNQPTHQNRLFSASQIITHVVTTGPFQGLAALVSSGLLNQDSAFAPVQYLRRKLLGNKVVSETKPCHHSCRWKHMKKKTYPDIF